MDLTHAYICRVIATVGLAECLHHVTYFPFLFGDFFFKIDSLSNFQVYSGKPWGWWWRTGKPGMLQSSGSQRVGHDWAIEHRLLGVRASLVAQGAKTPPAAQETEETSVRSLGQKDPLEEGRAWQPTRGRENPIDREAWWATDHKTQTGFSQEIVDCLQSTTWRIVSHSSSLVGTVLVCWFFPCYTESLMNLSLYVSLHEFPPNQC